MFSNIKKEFNNWTKYDYIWLLLANFIILGLGIRNQDSIASLVCAITGVTSVIFVSKQMISNYPISLINVALYAWLSYDAKLYGDFMLNAFYYIPTNIIGWVVWTKARNNSATDKIEVKRLSGEQAIGVAVATLAIIVIYSGILKMLGGNIPLIDSASTILSVIAMILMIKQYTEQWYMWVLVNIVSIIMWAVSLSQGVGDLSTLLMWIVFLINSLFGLYNWKKEAKQNV